MASIHKNEKTKRWNVSFRVQGRQFMRACGTKSEREARAIQAKIDDTIRLFETGRLPKPPDGVNLGDYIYSAGTLTTPKEAARLGEVCEAYLGDQVNKSANTLEGEKRHTKHLTRILGTGTRLDSLTLQKMQKYVAARLEEENRYGGKVSGTTIQKELLTFWQVWVWARRQKLVTTECPIKDPVQPKKWAVNIPKTTQQEPFMVWKEIERRILRENVPDSKQGRMWRRLFLDEEQAKELMTHVSKHSPHPVAPVLFGLAAYAGLRRSEILNAHVEDVRLGDNVMVVREKKRKKDKAGTTRQVPLTKNLKALLEVWLKCHPGGKYLVVENEHGQLSEDRAVALFRQTLAGSKWQVIPGFHVLRHTFGALALRAGIPMQITGTLMGHTTTQMMEYYQHVYGEDQQEWMKKFPLG